MPFPGPKHILHKSKRLILCGAAVVCIATVAVTISFSWNQVKSIPVSSSPLETSASGSLLQSSGVSSQSGNTSKHSVMPSSSESQADNSSSSKEPPSPSSKEAAAENTGSEPDLSGKPSVAPPEKEQAKPQQEHIHTYVSKRIAPTCTTAGYTVHTCKGCGAQYTDSRTPPQHELGKYLCLRCGKPEPSLRDRALIAWILENCPQNPQGTYWGREYVQGDSVYKIYASEYVDWIYFDCENQKEQTLFRLALDAAHPDACSLIYYNADVHAGLDLKRGALSSDMNIVWDDFSIWNEDTSCTEASLAAEVLSVLNGHMCVFEDQLLYPGTDFRFSTLGFAKFFR